MQQDIDKKNILSSMKPSYDSDHKGSLVSAHVLTLVQQASQSGMAVPILPFKKCILYLSQQE